MSIKREISLEFNSSPENKLHVITEQISHLGGVEYKSIIIRGFVDEFKDVFSYVFENYGFIGQELSLLDIRIYDRLNEKIISVVEFVIDNIGKSYGLEVELDIRQAGSKEMYRNLFDVIGKKVAKLQIHRDDDGLDVYIDLLPRMLNLGELTIESRFTAPQFSFFSRNLLAMKVWRIAISLDTRIDADVLENGIIPMFSEKSDLREIELRFQTRTINENVFDSPELLTRLTTLIVKTPRVINFSISAMPPGAPKFPDFYPNPMAMSLFRKRKAEFEEDEQYRGVAASIMSTTRGQLHGSVAIEASKFT